MTNGIPSVIQGRRQSEDCPVCQTVLYQDAGKLICPICGPVESTPVQRDKNYSVFAQPNPEVQRLAQLRQQRRRGNVMPEPQVQAQSAKVPEKTEETVVPSRMRGTRSLGTRTIQLADKE